MKKPQCVACGRLIPGPDPRPQRRRWLERHQVDLEGHGWMHPGCGDLLVAVAVALTTRPCRECGGLTDASDRLCLACWSGTSAEITNESEVLHA